MKTVSQNTARSAIGAALAVVILYFASLVPSGRLALVCLSSVSVVFVRMRCGKKWAAGCYAASAMLALLLLPEKGVPILYALFLGYYPLIKLETERFSNRMVRWIVRLGIFNAVFCILYFMLRQFFSSWLSFIPGSIWFLAVAANGIFILYDYALTQLILIYLRKIDRRF